MSPGDKNSKTLVLVCRRDFCRILDQVLRREGLSDFQHGNLSLVGGPTIEDRVGGATEVFVIPTDAELTDRLVSLLRACPIRTEAEEIFELYMVGEN